jgi:hypothetical protein
MCVTAALGGPLLYYQCAPFAILKPKNRKTEKHDLLSKAPALVQYGIELVRVRVRVRALQQARSVSNRVQIVTNFRCESEP